MLSCDCDFILLVNSLESSLCSSDCCKSVTVSATGAAADIYPDYLGRYVATGREHEGSPVFRNSDNKYLYRHSDDTWRASYVIGGYGYYKSVDTTAECPASISQWQYLDGDWHSGSITVKCN